MHPRARNLLHPLLDVNIHNDHDVRDLGAPSSLYTFPVSLAVAEVVEILPLIAVDWNASSSQAGCPWTSPLNPTDPGPSCVTVTTVAPPF